MVERTTITLPAALKRRAKARARAQQISLNELVRRAVENEVPEPPKGVAKTVRTEDTDDPFWVSFVVSSSGPSDGFANLEEYLYGGK